MSNVNDIDMQCIRQVLGGRKKAFAQLVDRYGRAVFAFVATMVPQKEDAEELAQDAFVKAYRQLKQYDGRASFYTWLSRIAYRLCLDYFRRRPAVWLETDERALQQVSDTEADEVMGTEDDVRIQLLVEAVHHLPPTERMLIQQHYFEGRPLTEIAAIVDADAATLATRLHRIRKKLLHYIKLHEDGTRYK